MTTSQRKNAINYLGYHLLQNNKRTCVAYKIVRELGFDSKTVDPNNLSIPTKEQISKINPDILLSIGRLSPVPTALSYLTVSTSGGQQSSDTVREIPTTPWWAVDYEEELDELDDESIATEEVVEEAEEYPQSGAQTFGRSGYGYNEQDDK